MPKARRIAKSNRVGVIRSDDVDEIRTPALAPTEQSKECRKKRLGPLSMRNRTTASPSKSQASSPSPMSASSASRSSVLGHCCACSGPLRVMSARSSLARRCRMDRRNRTFLLLKLAWTAPSLRSGRALLRGKKAAQPSHEALRVASRPIRGAIAAASDVQKAQWSSLRRLTGP